MDIVFKYFPQLTEVQRQRLLQLPELYAHWNAQINVVSRKDLEQLAERHVLHSLAIARVQPFKYGTEIMDLGTGGGFPGIPLAIMFDQARFTLVDSIGKKTKVAQEVANALGLTNVTVLNTRAERLEPDYDFIVSRAVAPLADLYAWTRGKVVKHYTHDLKNGLLVLKGGDLKDEIAELGRKVKVWELSQYFEEEFFETKKVVHVPLV